MPVTFSGLASGIDTDNIIEKLVKVEAAPIKKLQDQRIIYSRRKKELKELEAKLKKINTTLKVLHGFDASYEDKKASVSDSDVLEAKATKLADRGEKKIEVLQIASTHKIATDAHGEKDKLPAGRFFIEIDKVKYPVRFRGGRIEKLKDAIDESAQRGVSTSLINTIGDKYIIAIESKTPGVKGTMKITGKESFLRATGLMTDSDNQPKKDTLLIFDDRYFTGYIGKEKIDKQDGSLKVSKEGKSVSIKGHYWREYTLPTETPIDKDTQLEFTMNYTKPGKGPKKEESGIPFRVEFGPQEKITVKGITLDSYNVSRVRPMDKKPPRKRYDIKLGIGVVALVNGKRVEKVYPLSPDSKGKQEIPIFKDFKGKKITKIVFFSNEGTGTFSDAKITTPIKGEGKLKPKNEIAAARNARVKIDGIVVEREKNTELNNIIKGVSITLKQKSKTPIHVKIDPDVEKAIEKIKNFVTAYNEYLDFHKKLIKVDKQKKPGHRDARREGLFIGDMTLVRLNIILRRKVNGAYVSNGERPIRLLTQMGISTGAIGSKWGKLKDNNGKLTIDEAKLKSVIVDNPQGVKDFFGADTDGDRIPDTGMALATERILRPYIMTGKNIISTKIALQDESDKSTKDRIERMEKHLVAYRERLKKKFTRMEQHVSSANSQKSWMNSHSNSSSKNK